MRSIFFCTFSLRCCHLTILLRYCKILKEDSLKFVVLVIEETQLLKLWSGTEFKSKIHRLLRVWEIQKGVLWLFLKGPFLFGLETKLSRLMFCAFGQKLDLPTLELDKKINIQYKNQSLCLPICKNKVDIKFKIK